MRTRLICRVFGLTFKEIIKNIIRSFFGSFNRASISVSACG